MLARLFGRLLLAITLLILSGVALGDTQTVAIPDSGWKLWLDKSARWQNEPVYLSGDAPIGKMASHPPTPGWAALANQNATVVELPTTVEQHFWGTNGLRAYNNEYFYLLSISMQ